MYLIPWLGPQVTPAISTLEVPGPIEIQSSPVHESCYYIKLVAYHKNSEI